MPLLEKQTSSGFRNQIVCLFFFCFVFYVSHQVSSTAAVVLMDSLLQWCTPTKRDLVSLKDPLTRYERISNNSANYQAKESPLLLIRLSWKEL